MHNAKCKIIEGMKKWPNPSVTGHFPFLSSGFIIYSFVSPLGVLIALRYGVQPFQPCLPDPG